MKKKVREEYRKRLFLPEISYGEEIEFFTKSGTHIATGYERVVIGDRGPYIEFNDEMMTDNLFVPWEQEYRIGHGVCYYEEWRSNDDSYVKVYYQKRLVKYADYKLEMWYILPFDLTSKEYTSWIHVKE